MLEPALHNSSAPGACGGFRGRWIILFLCSYIYSWQFSDSTFCRSARE